MSELEKYCKFSKDDAIYYLKPRKGSEKALSKVVGLGTDLCCIFSMKPSEALNLLKWLEQERETLECLAKEQEALDHVEYCLEMLHTDIMVGLHPQEAANGPVGLQSQKEVVEGVKEDFKKLSEAIQALRKGQ